MARTTTCVCACTHTAAARAPLKSNSRAASKEREYSRGQVGAGRARDFAGINIRETGGVPIYNGDIIDDYLRFRVDNRKFCWQKGAGRFETLPSIPRFPLALYSSVQLLLSLVPRRCVSLFPPSKLSLSSSVHRHYPCKPGRQVGCDSKVRDDFDSGTAGNLRSIPASIGPVWARNPSIKFTRAVPAPLRS